MSVLSSKVLPRTKVRKYESTKVLSKVQRVLRKYFRSTKYKVLQHYYVYVYACVQRTRLHVSDKEGDSGTRAAPPPSGGDGDAEHAHVLYVK